MAQLTERLPQHHSSFVEINKLNAWQLQPPLIGVKTKKSAIAREKRVTDILIDVCEIKTHVNNMEKSVGAGDQIISAAGQTPGRSVGEKLRSIARVGR